MENVARTDRHGEGVQVTDMFIVSQSIHSLVADSVDPQVVKCSHCPVAASKAQVSAYLLQRHAAFATTSRESAHILPAVEFLRA